MRSFFYVMFSYKDISEFIKVLLTIWRGKDLK